MRVKVSTLFGLIGYAWHLPRLAANTQEVSIEVQSRQDGKEREQRVRWDDLMRQLKRQDLRLIRRMARRLLGRLVIKEWRWKSALGTGDAATTGWLSGGMWTLVASLTNWLCRQCHMETRPLLQITPHFHQKIFAHDISVHCQVRIWHLLQTGWDWWRYRRRLKRIHGHSHRGAYEGHAIESQS